MGKVLTVLREHREQREEIGRLTDLFHAVNGILIVSRSTETPLSQDDIDRIEGYCREALNYPPDEVAR